jgi:hypothetical protein
MSSNIRFPGQFPLSPSSAKPKSDWPPLAGTRRPMRTKDDWMSRRSTDTTNEPETVLDQSPTRIANSANLHQTLLTTTTRRPTSTSRNVSDAALSQTYTRAPSAKTTCAPKLQSHAEESDSLPQIAREAARYTHEKLCEELLKHSNTQKGWIYIYREPGSKESCFKIGWTSRRYMYRMDEHKSCCRFKPDVVHVSSQSIKNCARLESLIQHDLAHKKRLRPCPTTQKIHNEWFVVSKEEAIQTVKLWEQFMHQQEPYNWLGSLSIVWRHLLEQRCPADLDIARLSHDARRQHWVTILAPPTINDYIHGYIVYAGVVCKNTYDFVGMFFWQLSTLLYGLYTLALCRNLAAIYVLFILLGCAMLPSLRLRSTKKRAGTPKKKA